MPARQVCHKWLSQGTLNVSKSRLPLTENEASSSDTCVVPKEIKNFRGHPLLLLQSKLRIHGQRENFGGSSLGDRKVTFLIAHIEISFLKMQRHRVVNSRADASFCKLPLQSIAVF